MCCRRFLAFLALAAILSTGIATAAPPTDAEKVTVDIRDIRTGGKVAVLGNLGIPIGQIVTLEGQLAKPSKVSNNMTLHFTKVNGVAVAKESVLARRHQMIQVQNVDFLPENETIIVEGYEFLQWRGDPQTNWSVNTAFVITKVIAPKSLKVNAWRP